MGMGTFESEYITTDYVPTIYACGEKESNNISKEGFPKFAKRLEELDVNHVSMMEEGLGHELPYGFDKKLGVDRYQLLHDFFDRYLKPGAKLPPAVLMVTPRDGAEDVSPASEIAVHFAPIIDERTILEKSGIRVVRLANNEEAKGTWRSTRKGTRFVFVPERPLKTNEDYQIVISKEVRDKAGTALEAARTIRFGTAR